MREHPSLFEAAMRDEDVYDFKHGEWEPNDSAKYVGVEENGELASCIQLDGFTNVAANIHMYVPMEKWGTGKSDEYFYAFQDWAKDNIMVYKFINFVPAECKEVAKALLRVGFKLTPVLVFTIKVGEVSSEQFFQEN